MFKSSTMFARHVLVPPLGCILDGCEGKYKAATRYVRHVQGSYNV